MLKWTNGIHFLSDGLLSDSYIMHLALCLYPSLCLHFEHFATLYRPCRMMDALIFPLGFQTSSMRFQPTTRYLQFGAEAISTCKAVTFFVSFALPIRPSESPNDLILGFHRLVSNFIEFVCLWSFAFVSCRVLTIV